METIQRRDLNISRLSSINLRGTRQLDRPLRRIHCLVNRQTTLSQRQHRISSRRGTSASKGFIITQILGTLRHTRHHITSRASDRLQLTHDLRQLTALTDRIPKERATTSNTNTSSHDTRKFGDRTQGSSNSLTKTTGLNRRTIKGITPRQRRLRSRALRIIHPLSRGDDILRSLLRLRLPVRKGLLRLP